MDTRLSTPFLALSPWTPVTLRAEVGTAKIMLMSVPRSQDRHSSWIVWFVAWFGEDPKPTPPVVHLPHFDSSDALQYESEAIVLVRSDRVIAAGPTVQHAHTPKDSLAFKIIGGALPSHGCDTVSTQIIQIVRSEAAMHCELLHVGGAAVQVHLHRKVVPRCLHHVLARASANSTDACSLGEKRSEQENGRPLGAVESVQRHQRAVPQSPEHVVLEAVLHGRLQREQLPQPPVKDAPQLRRKDEESHPQTWGEPIMSAHQPHHQQHQHQTTCQKCSKGCLRSPCPANARELVSKAKDAHRDQYPNPISKEDPEKRVPPWRAARITLLDTHQLLSKFVH